MITLPKLKTEHLRTMTRTELETRIVNLEAALEGRAADLERVIAERDSYKLEVESYKPGIGLNEELRAALEVLNAKFEGVEPLHHAFYNVLIAYRAVRDGGL